MIHLREHIWAVEEAGMKRIPGLEWMATDKSGGIYSLKSKKYLKPYETDAGYHTVRIFFPDGRYKNKRVHRLIALAWIPNPEGKEQVNHINGNKKDNRVENLEWCTPSENSMHSVETGLFVAPSGERHIRSAKIIQLNLDRQIVKRWVGFREIERNTGYTRYYISNCCKGDIKSAYGFYWEYESPSLPQKDVT